MIKMCDDLDFISKETRSSSNVREVTESWLKTPNPNVRSWISNFLNLIWVKQMHPWIFSCVQKQTYFDGNMLRGCCEKCLTLMSWLSRFSTTSPLKKGRQRRQKSCKKKFEILDKICRHTIMCWGGKVLHLNHSMTYGCSLSPAGPVGFFLFKYSKI